METRSEESNERRAIEGFNTIWLAAAGIVPLLGLAPMLLVEAFRIWDRPHYRFAPLPLFVFLVLLGLHFRSAQASKSRQAFATGSVLAGMLLGLVSIYFFMPTLAHAALTFTLLGWLSGQWGTTRMSRIVSMIALIAVTIPLPFNLDVAIIRNLQVLASYWTSAALDTFGVHHFLSGGVLSGRYFDIQILRVGGGTDSVFFLLGLACILIAVRRHGWLGTVLLLASIPLWSVVYGTISQSAIGLYGDSLDTYAEELPFSVVRATCFAVVFISIILFDIGLVAAVRPSQWSKLAEGEWLNEDEQLTLASDLKVGNPTANTLLIAGSSVMLIAGLASAWLIASNYSQARGERVVSLVPRELITAQSTLPTQVAEWTQTDYRSVISRSGTSLEYQWIYSRGLEQVQFVLTPASTRMAPWTGVQGWRISGGPIEQQSTNNLFSVTNMEDPNGNSAVLLSSIISVTGQVERAMAEDFEVASPWRSIFTKLSDESHKSKDDDYIASAFFASIARQEKLDPAVANLVSTLLQSISQKYQIESPAEVMAAPKER